MKKDIKVSVIVPVYNAEKYLPETIKALAVQTLEEIEFILVDDGSKDHSGALCDVAAKNDRRFIAVHQQNQGVSVARNTGIENASGEYLMFTDADDLPAAAQAERLYRKAVSGNADAVLCGFTKVSGSVENEEILPYTEPITEKNEILHRLIMPMIVWGYRNDSPDTVAVYGSVWRGLYKKELIVSNDIRFRSGIRLGEDMLFNMQFWGKCKKIDFVSESLYIYVENSASATHTKLDTMWQRYKRTWTEVHEQLKSLTDESNLIKWHNYQLSRYAVSAIVEGICSKKVSLLEKYKPVKKILRDLKQTVPCHECPENISHKEKSILKLIYRFPAVATLAYYQYRYNTVIRRK